MKRSPIWDTPFFEERHHRLADRLLAWNIPEVEHDPADLNSTIRLILSSLAESNLLDLVIPHEGGKGAIDLRAICLVREVLSYRSGGIADTAFAMQGIGTAPIWLSGSHAFGQDYLLRARVGETIAAFALTEPESGSDVANICTDAQRDGGDFILNGVKTFISNAGIADHYVIIARTGEAPGAKGLSAFLVDADTPGLSTESQTYIALHAGGSIKLEDCRVSADRLLGAPGTGFQLAMATFDIFRASVGAAALGYGRRALDESLARTSARKLFGKLMSEIDGVQTSLAEMVTDLETASLVVYRAAWLKDTSGLRASSEASMAKLVGTEYAQRVIDKAVQLFGGAGVTVGSTVERLYREIRPLRIYEGASEVQKLIIARNTLKALQLQN